MVLWKFSDLVTATPSILSLLGSSLAGCHDGNLIKQLSSSQYQCVFFQIWLKHACCCNCVIQAEVCRVIPPSERPFPWPESQCSTGLSQLFC
jgi:hypothetical protein